MGDGVAVLGAAQWHALRDAHLARVSPITREHRARRVRGEKHPVLDFLFTYYSFRPARLERWHPGPGVVLTGAAEYLDWAGYTEVGDGVGLDPAAFTASRRRTAEFVLALLGTTASRPPRLGCFGLHEWAMVYRTDPEEIGTPGGRCGSGTVGPTRWSRGRASGAATSTRSASSPSPRAR